MAAEPGRGLPPALARLLGALAGLALGLVVGARACGLPLAPGQQVVACLLEVRQDAGPAVVSAREVARDVAGSSVLPALAASGLGPAAWTAAWLGEDDVVLVASAPDLGSAEALLGQARSGLAAAVDAHDAGGDAFTLVGAGEAGETGGSDETSETGGSAETGAGSSAAAVRTLADRLAACGLAGALSGGLLAEAARLARRALRRGADEGGSR